jgi:DNA polymerase
VVEKHGENGHLRQKGKVAELALGYGGGVGALRSMDSSGSLNEDELPGIVEKWRAASPKVVRMWKRCQDAAVAVVGSDKPRTVNVKDLKLRFQTSLCGSSKVLTIWLPNGRPIRYWEPEIAEGKFGLEISYMNQNQTTKKWERTKTYGGKLTENIVQSIARDCLADKMKELDHLGYDIAFHVHDELILDAPRDMSAEVVDKVMGQDLPWAPGLPLQGSTYECEFYRKD